MGASTRVVHPVVTMPSSEVEELHRARNVALATEAAPKSPARGKDNLQAESPTAQASESNSAAVQIHWCRTSALTFTVSKSFMGTPAN